MTTRKRLILVIASVTMGSFASALLLKSRIGTLNPIAWQQLAINFLFAGALVFVIGIFLSRNKK